MKYFLLEQDNRYSNVPKIADMYSKIDRKNLNLVDEYKIKDTIILYAHGDSDTKYLDILERPKYIVSEKMKKILNEYTDNIVFKYLPLIDIENKIQNNYYLPIFEEADVLSSKTEFNLVKTDARKIVLDGRKIKKRRIFKISGLEKTKIVISLDVAESILRRDILGVNLKELEVEIYDGSEQI